MMLYLLVHNAECRIWNPAEKQRTITRRDELRELIGEEAESLVWLFCMMRRETFFLDLGKDGSPSVEHRESGERIPLSDTQPQDLLTLLFANSLEAFPVVFRPR
jgi:hypothetical protein